MTPHQRNTGRNMLRNNVDNIKCIPVLFVTFVTSLFQKVTNIVTMIALCITHDDVGYIIFGLCFKHVGNYVDKFVPNST